MASFAWLQSRIPRGWPPAVRKPVSCRSSSTSASSKKVGSASIAARYHRNQRVPVMALELVAESLIHAYNGQRALDDVSVRVRAATVTALVGESGSGKTTLLRSFNRLVEPNHGTVTIGGAD